METTIEIAYMGETIHYSENDNQWHVYGLEIHAQSLAQAKERIRQIKKKEFEPFQAINRSFCGIELVTVTSVNYETRVAFVRYPKDDRHGRLNLDNLFPATDDNMHHFEICKTLQTTITSLQNGREARIKLLKPGPLQPAKTKPATA